MDETFLIHHLSEKLDMNPKTIRFYEDEGVIPKAKRNSSNYRIYNQEDLKRLSFIKKARMLGISIEEIKNIFKVREGGDFPCHQVVDLLDKEIIELEKKIEEMIKFKAKLTECVNNFKEHFDKGKDGDVCGLIEILFEE